LKYFKKYNIKNISEDFIHDYYIFSNSIYISVVEFIKWINIRRDTMITNILNNYKENEDYYFTTIDDEKKCVKIYDVDTLIFKKNQMYIKITSDCFKDICIKSSTENGKLVRSYYKSLDKLFQKFHLETIEKLLLVKEALLNIDKGGIYIWKKQKDNTTHYRIGNAIDVYGNLNNDNIYNIYEIKPKIIIYTNYSDLFKKILKNILKQYRKGEIYVCSFNIMNNKINNLINFIENNINDFICDKILYKINK
jgi:phage anti-repressor protein